MPVGVGDPELPATDTLRVAFVPTRIDVLDAVTVVDEARPVTTSVKPGAVDAA